MKEIRTLEELQEVPVGESITSSGGVVWSRKSVQWWAEEKSRGTYYSSETIMQFAPFTYEENQ